MKVLLKEYTNYLHGYTKVEIRDFAGILGFHPPYSLTKSGMVDRLAEYLEDFPGQWLARLPEWDLKILRYLCAQAPGEHMVDEYAGYTPVVEMLGIVKSVDTGDGSKEFWLPEEFFHTVRDHIDAVIEEAESSGLFLVEHIVMGLLYLYGAREFESLLEELMELVKKHRPECTDALWRFIRNTPLFTLYKDYGSSRYRFYIVSPELYDVKAVEEGWKLYSDISKRKKFSFEEILQAGTGAPDFCFGLDSPEGKRFTDMLLKIGYYPESVPMVAHDVWMASQIEDHLMLEDIYGPVADQMDMIMNEEDYLAALQIVADYVNTLPRWQLKGFSPKEKGYMTLEFNPSDAPAFIPPEEEYDHWQMPRPSISEGYTDLIEKDDKISPLLKLMPEGFPFGMAIPHVSKDDPCPCGSGLKYGSCHGKVMN